MTKRLSRARSKVHRKSLSSAQTDHEFRSATQSLDEAIVISDSKGSIIFWNEGAERIFGYKESHILGKPLALLIPMRSSALREGHLEHILFSKAAPMDRMTHELRGIRADGARFPVELSLLAWHFGEKQFFVTVIRDITERKRLHKAILEISGREQQRIGQDLHDDICQQLTAITLLAEVLESNLKEIKSPLAKDAGEIQAFVARVIAHTRLLARGLLPVKLESMGLSRALEQLAASTQRYSRLSCQFKGGHHELVREKVVAVHLYRIAQEAVLNATKHGHASRVEIALKRVRGQIRLTISDNGIGFLSGAMRKGGLGLSIMNSRAETINASLRISRGPRGGTLVSCALQLPFVTPPAQKRRPYLPERRHESR